MHFARRRPAGPLAGANQGVEQNQLAALCRCKIMRRPFGNMADRAGTQLQAPAVDTEPAPAFEHLADDILVAVNDLLPITAFYRAESDQAAGELFFLEAAPIANLVVQFGKLLQGGLKFDKFHFESGAMGSH